MRDVACHPTLPILATRLDDGTVCLWDATTYRLERIIRLESSIQHTAFKDTADSIWLVVACEDGMEILKINMPTSTK